MSSGRFVYFYFSYSTTRFSYSLHRFVLFSIYSILEPFLGYFGNQFWPGSYDLFKHPPIFGEFWELLGRFISELCHNQLWDNLHILRKHQQNTNNIALIEGNSFIWIFSSALGIVMFLLSAIQILI